MDREQSILEAAAALPPPERCGFLDVVCAGQPEMRARIEALVRSHDAARTRGVPGSRKSAAAEEMIATDSRRMR